MDHWVWLYPQRAIVLTIITMFGLTAVYFVAVWRRFGKTRDGIYRVWPRDALPEQGSASDPLKHELVRATFFKSIGYACYFSMLSAFHIGWHDLNFGTWIARIQPREYRLRARGWVRVISGTQSLLSVYLFAIWALTQFGRPFQ
jgi:hypothetical protein